MKKRIISLLLCLCMVFSLLPTAVLAANGEDPNTTAGSGQVMQQDSEKSDDTEGQDTPTDPEQEEPVQGPTAEEQLAEMIENLPDPSEIDPLDEEQVEAIYNQLEEIYEFAEANGLGDRENGLLDEAANATVNTVIAAAWPAETLESPTTEGGMTGTCGATDKDSVNWALTQNSDGPTYTLTISGDGAMADYTDPTKPDAEGANIAPWYNSYSTTITEVQINEGVTSIGDNAFKDLTSLEKANIPASITDLGDHIFRGDTNLTTVEWADGFQAHDITDTDSNSGTYAGPFVPTSMFDGCSSLGKDVELSGWLPSSFTGVGCAAFRGTKFTVNFDAWSKLNYIGAYAFSEMPNLDSFTLTDSIIIGLRYDMSNAFAKSGLKSLTVDAETVPSRFAFSAQNLAEIVLTDKVTNINAGAFQGTAITELVIPSGVEKLGTWSFLNCSSLKKLTLLGEITLEGVQFPGTSLEELVIDKDAVVTCTDDPFRATGDYPAMTSLKKASILGTFTSSSADTDTKTFWRCFSRNADLTEVVLSGKNADNFSGTAFPNVTTLSILRGDAKLPGYILGGDSKLEQVTIDVDNYSSESGSFRYAKCLKTFRLKADSATLDNRAFVECPSLVAVDLTECSSITYGDNTFSAMTTTGQNNEPTSHIATIYVNSTSADPKGADNKAGLSDSHGIVAITNGGTFPADAVFETGKLATPTKEGYAFGGWYTKDGTNGDWGNKVTDVEPGQTYYAKWMGNIPEPTEADFTNENELVTVKCLNPVAHPTMQYGLTAAAQKYTKKQLSATEYSVTYDADAFAVNGHSLYSADKLNWKLTYDGSKWNLAPNTDVDDVVLVTHAPTTFDEVTKFIDGQTDVIHTSCVNGETATCAYGLMAAFVKPGHVVSVEQEEDSSSGKPIRGRYIATLKVDQFAETCANACNGKSFADSPRAHDVLSEDTVQWRFKVTEVEVRTDAGTEKQYVWSAEPVEADKDDVCQVAHRVVLTFSYDQNGVKVDDTKVEYKYNTTEITGGTVPTPTREGYTFVRWLDADDNAFVPTATVTEDHTYNNIEWKPIKYRVIFNANAGGKTVTGTMADQVFTYDQPQTLNPNQFVCTNSVFDDRLKKDTRLYEFGGWNTAADGSGAAYTDEQEVSNLTAESEGEITLYAQWKHVTKTLTYVSAHGTAPSAADVDIFTEVTVAGAPANVEGYTFVGWRSDIDGLRETFKSGDKFVMPNTDVTLTAQWEKEADSYTVTYADGNWSEVKGSYKAGETVTVLAPAPAPEGYTFKYWRSSNEGKTYQPGDTFPMPKTNVILTAVWDSETYTITWKNGDTILSETTVKHGEKPEYIGETPTKDATVDKTYTFKGWTPEITAATEDTTYTAQFEETTRTYTVKFFNEGGTLLDSKQVEYGVIPKLGREPKKEGDAQYSYKFKAWSPKLVPVTGDAEYYATYTKTVNKYTVTWIIDGDSTEETYEYGKMPAHADPVKAATDDTAYTFKGWTPALSIVTGNVTYTAQFDEITKHTVSYDLAGGTPAIASAKYAEGEAVNTPATVPTKTGYVFTGWLVSFENKTVNANGSFTMPNTDVTLTAQWRVAITGNVYILAMDPEHGRHEEEYNAQLTAQKDNATGDPVAAGDVQFVLVDANGHADTSRNIGHDLKLNADGSITGTANGAGEVTFRVRLANADGDFVSDAFEFTIVIEKAFRTCTVTMEGWTYGDEPNKPVVTLYKTEGTESYTYFYKVKDAAESTYTMEVPVNAGDYTVKVVVAESANYKSCEGTADFTIHKALITSVDPVVTAPVACEAAQSTIADGNGYTGTITWAPAPVDGKFDYATEYTATVVLTPDSNHYFTANTTAEGWSVSYDETSGKLTLTHKFEKTELGKIETPVIHPNGGRFTGRQTVKITCATEGADIYYTLDGTTPTTGSEQYTGAFKIKESTTVKAIAVKANYIDSAVATAEFTKRTGGNGGGGGGTVVTPVKPSKKDDSLKFNTEDHFAYVNGYPDGTVKPTGDVTRAEVAAILYRVMDADCVKTYETTRCSFSDVVRGDWFNLYVATLENADVIVDTRTNGKFRPNEAITRAELAAMLAQFADIKSAANSFNDVSARHWASDEIAVCAKMGWINGYPDGSFRPDATITRAEMMAMINRALGRTPKSADDLLSGMKTWRDNANVNAWYYLDVQEATNSHTYTKSGTHETWKKLR